ncbi:acyl-CoA thioesterase [Janibacter sp. Soil728]|uniref:acyl-CoA thioesterase n=1 Tax=Janibacter sp. Soil728 TaxID=1736393 RepID=UPI0006FD55F6|nr:thioesterase family protein [Janibacter sp. Soil728]KRE38837.1 acyl-CoA thioesterase [Janibacter sp. Soil728]
MNLQEMLDQAASGTAHVEGGWGQGRATYGGLVGALAYSALRAQLTADPRPPLRSLTVNFVAPVGPGQAEVEATILRAGSSATQGLVQLRQDDKVAAAVLAAFGAPRTSAIRVEPTAVTMPDLPDPESIEPFPYIPGATPDFFQHVELRLADGSAPFAGADTSHMSGWMRFRQAPPTFDERHFIALADAWPPAVIQMLPTPAPGSSLTWTLELLGDVTAEPDTHWAYAVHTDQAGDGYAHTDARIWHPDGRLVAISRQTVSVFG